MRRELFALLGGWPEPRPSAASSVAVREFAEYRVEYLNLRPTRPGTVVDVASIPAVFCRPNVCEPNEEGLFPAVLYCHAHGGNYRIGKSELLAARPALPMGAYGPALAQRGIASLCIDLPCFGERACSESALAKKLLWHGDTLFGMMLRELAGALDYLCARQDTDANRIATLGLSMGATTAWWLAALDERVGAVAELCCFADLETLIAQDGHDLHSIYMTVPGLVQRFSTADIARLIVPRPHLCTIGTHDPLTPAQAVSKATRELAQSYADAGRPHAWQLLIETNSGHVETKQMREAVLAFLAAELGSGVASG